VRLDNAIAERHVWNVHGVVIVRNGALVLERYFAGEDSARGRPSGKIMFQADTLHDLRSVSKSIVGLLYGIAPTKRPRRRRRRSLPHSPNTPTSQPTLTASGGPSTTC